MEDNQEPSNQEQRLQQIESAPEVAPEVPVAPLVPSTAVATATTTQNSPGIIVLQWLTYAFWGWALLSTIWLVYIVLANFIVGSDLTPVIPYAIAATLVLLPLSFVCDLFYGRKEVAKKTGASTVVMVIHAVIFALFGIGVLISAVFLLVGMFINDGFTEKMPITMLFTLLISAVLYGFTFVRTINYKVGKVYRYVMAALVGVFVVLAFVGPVARSAATKDDRDIVSNMSDIPRAIENYYEANSKLPTSLASVSLDEKPRSLVDRGLVTYSAEGGLKYQLCATFKEASEYRDSYGTSSQNGYSTYLSVYEHGSGKQCYKMQVSDYGV